MDTPIEPIRDMLWRWWAAKLAGAEDDGVSIMEPWRAAVIARAAAGKQTQP